MGRAEGRDNGGVTTETTVAPAAAFEPATTVGPRVTGSASSRIRMYPLRDTCQGGDWKKGRTRLLGFPDQDESRPENRMFR